jgi:hypothetical protein
MVRSSAFSTSTIWRCTSRGAATTNLLELSGDGDGDGSGDDGDDDGPARAGPGPVDPTAAARVGGPANRFSDGARSSPR